MHSTHSAAACRVSLHSAARLRKPCGRSSTTRSVTGLPRLRSRRANMTESSSMGSRAHACGRVGTRGHGELRNEFNWAPWPLLGFSLPPETHRFSSLSLTLQALLLLHSLMESNKITKENGRSDSLPALHSRHSLLQARLSPQVSPLTFLPSPLPGALFPRSICTQPAPILTGAPYPSGAHHNVHWWQALQHAVRCQQR